MSYPIDQATPVLKLSNNMRYSFVACDREAKIYISALARTMNLKESAGHGKKVLVYVSDNKNNNPDVTLPENGSDPICCSLLPGQNTDLFYIQVEKIARAVVADIIRNGGALIHGGLCSYKGSGAVMAGPGNIGKTTASSRLPAPWLSYSDDATLLLPAGTGYYDAHPWPTWSRFYFGDTGGTWVVEQSIPLSSLFFLRQSEKDLVEPLDQYQAKAMIIDTIEHVTRLTRWKDQDRHAFVNQYVQNAEKIASAVPAYRLAVSLDGEFWLEMEKVMPPAEAAVKTRQAVKTIPGQDDREKLHYIYRGASMNPTLFEPEMVTIIPYRDRNPKKGDIICYRLGSEKDGVVHRIVAVKGTSLKTRGDNSDCADDYTVDQRDVIGRVVASTRTNKTRTIYSGPAGILDMYLNRLSRKFNHFIAKLLHKSYHCLAASGLFRKLKPKTMAFKVVIFERYLTKYPKLILNRRTIGTYDYRRNTWHIKRPYRLFIDEKTLPLFEQEDI